MFLGDLHHLSQVSKDLGSEIMIMCDSTMQFFRRFWEKNPTGTRNDPVWEPVHRWACSQRLTMRHEQQLEHSQSPPESRVSFSTGLLQDPTFTVPEQNPKHSSKRRFYSPPYKGLSLPGFVPWRLGTLTPPVLLPWNFVQAPLSPPLHSLMALREQLVCQTNLSSSYKA